MGKWAREQVEVFCVANLINCSLEADEENLVMDFHCTVADGGMKVGFLSGQGRQAAECDAD